MTANDSVGSAPPRVDPGREAFASLARPSGADDADTGTAEGGPVVVYASAELPDVEPLTAYAALVDADLPTADGPDGDEPSVPNGASEHAFLLESAEKVASSDPDGAFRPSPADPGRHARYSFVGYAPDARVRIGPDGRTIDALRPDAPVDLMDTAGDDVTDALRSALPNVERRGFPDDARLSGGLVGFLGYDAVYDLALDEVGVDRPDSPVPDAEFVLNTRTVVFDELAGTVELVFTPVLHPGDDAGAIHDDLEREAARVAAILADAPAPDHGGFAPVGEHADPRESYEGSVRTAKEHVLDGDIYQGVLSRRRIREGDVDPRALYAALREVNPSPYMYLLAGPERTVVGASPETLVSVRDDRVTVNPIAGTCERGSSPVEDRRLAGEMLADDKERAEHTMLVDLARNDVRRVATPGSVRVEEFMAVLKYSHVQHIESTVVGDLAAADAFDALRATFPAGTLTGAPKIRAMEIIDAEEDHPRGVYGGGVGYVSWDGNADSAIVIRSATIEHDVEAETADADGSVDRVTVRAGAGIVADSDPASEYDETENKMDGVLVALDRITAGGDRGTGTDSEQSPTEPEVGR